MTSPADPPLKKRRLDAAKSALHKPFRSPLRPAGSSANTDSDESKTKHGTDSAMPRDGTTGCGRAYNTPVKVARGKASGENPPFKTPVRRGGTSLAGDTFMVDKEGVNKDKTHEEQGEIHPLLFRTPAKPSGSSSKLAAHRPFTPSSLGLSQVLAASLVETTATDETGEMKTPARHRPSVSRTLLANPAVTPNAARGPRDGAMLANTGETDPDADISAAQARVKALESRARTLRSQMDILTQASSLPRHSRLPELEKKWRLVAQEAAEQVLDQVSARVKNNGGMSAYRRNEKEDKKIRAAEEFAWDVAERQAGAGRARTSSDQDQDAGCGDDGAASHGRSIDQETLEAIQQQQQRQRQADKEQEDDEEEEEDDEFTMNTMLAFLHIEPEVIGWDTKNMQWTDA